MPIGVAYQNAAAYAKERRQGRSLKGPTEPDKPADHLLVHPDVRRMLMEIRAFNESDPGADGVGRAHPGRGAPRAGREGETGSRGSAWSC